MSASEAETFRRENYIIADIIVFLENLIFHNIPDEDLPFSILRAIGKQMERIFVVVEVVAFRFMMDRISMYVSARSCCFCS